MFKKVQVRSRLLAWPEVSFWDRGHVDGARRAGDWLVWMGERPAVVGRVRAHTVSGRPMKSGISTAWLVINAAPMIACAGSSFASIAVSGRPPLNVDRRLDGLGSWCDRVGIGFALERSDAPQRLVPQCRGGLRNRKLAYWFHLWNATTQCGD
jgi:hypothetical protein